jgi:hypothetical protein
MSLKLFINSIENIYQNMNIYRAIIIINNEIDISLLLNKLRKNNHNPKIIEENTIINYNYKLFIIFDENLLNKFNKNYYNLIIIY